MRHQQEKEEEEQESDSDMTILNKYPPTTMKNFSTSTAFHFFISARICSALYSNISDCDEVFNYWEPMHFLVERFGKQTWEYSPDYAIRSYGYLWLHTIPALVLKSIFGNEVSKTLVFYYTRLLLALICAGCETYLFVGVGKRFGPLAGRLVLAVLVFSVGMMVSATAFLPSSFSMYGTMLVLGGWMQGHYRVSILATIASVLLGWPFTGIISIPVGVHMLMTPIITWKESIEIKNTLSKKMANHVKYLVTWTIICFALIAVSIFQNQFLMMEGHVHSLMLFFRFL